MNPYDEIIWNIHEFMHVSDGKPNIYCEFCHRGIIAVAEVRGGEFTGVVCPKDHFFESSDQSWRSSNCWHSTKDWVPVNLKKVKVKKNEDKDVIEVAIKYSRRV